MSLAPCTACARHVRRTETRCPFCEAPLSLAPLPSRTPSERLGRAALFAFGTAVATTAIGCGTKTDLGVGAGEGAVADAAFDRDAGGVPVLYGGSPWDAGPDVGCCNADYGGPPLRDAGVMDAAIGTDANLLPTDAAPTDVGPVDVGVDADFTALYGAPPPPPPPPDEP